MKKAIALVVSLILVVAFGTVVMAQEKAPAKPAEKKEAAPAEKKAPATVKQVTGEVAAVDANAKTVTVKAKKADVVISVTDKTKITLGKEKKTLADIKAGDKVTVKYTEVDKKNVAKSIAIAAPKKTEKKPEAKPAEKPAAKPAEKPAEPAKKPAGY
ncbi:MAG: hypothetical protein HZC12_10375 [Nitrospirae bacterium]|nr:hypothetical protein [Nitrospirota bacterium]